MPDPRILILYNEPVLPADHPDRLSESDVLYSAKIVRESLQNVGIPYAEYGFADNIPAFLDRLACEPPDAIFNLYEGPADNSVTEVYLAGLLEWLKFPFTGSPSQSLAICRNKMLAKRIFAGSDVPTPAFVVINQQPCPDNPVGWPAIVKPAEEDASVGIEQASVVTNTQQLHDRVEFVRSHYGGSVLVEKFIEGRELHVSVVDIHGTGELVPLPIAEVAFEAAESHGFWPVYTYTAKWNEDSEEFKHASIRVGVEVPDAIRDKLTAIAGHASRVLGCRDYARIDTRVTPNGDVYVLEVNPNPSIYSVMIDEGLPAMGLTYDAFIAAVVRNALGRRGPAPVGHRRYRMLGV